MGDVLKPELVWIEGRCYRINEPTADLSHLQEHDLYEEEITYQEVEDDADDDGNFEIIGVDNGRFSTKFHVSQHYLGSIIGKKGLIKRKIESETRTEIRIPKQYQEGDVIVLGPSAASVKAARRKINTIVVSTRMKQSPTHFISIPLNSHDVQSAFNKFKEEILEDQCDRGLSEDMFVFPAQLHLTLCVLCLMDNEERLLASKLLTEAREKIILPSLHSEPLRMHLKGVSYMNDDPHEVSVLYGTVDEAEADTTRLQKLAEDILQYFTSSGLAKREGRNRVKLHMTLIKSTLSKEVTEAEYEESLKKKGRTRKTFDASRILEKYADYEFGEQQLTEMHLSQMYASGADKYYQATCIVSCTEQGLQ